MTNISISYEDLIVPNEEPNLPKTLNKKVLHDFMKSVSNQQEAYRMVPILLRILEEESILNFFYVCASMHGLIAGDIQKKRMFLYLYDMHSFAYRNEDDDIQKKKIRAILSRDPVRDDILQYEHIIGSGFINDELLDDFVKNTRNQKEANQMIPVLERILEKNHFVDFFYVCARIDGLIYKDDTKKVCILIYMMFIISLMQNTF
jgi:hypothetical protein